VSAPSAAESGPPPGVAAGIGVLLLMLAALLVVDAQRLPPASALGVGPAAAMRLVAAFLALLDMAHLATAWRQRRQDAGSSDTAPANSAAVVWVLGALAGLMLVLQVGGGFIVASAWLFALTARGFGAPLGVKSIGIGLTLSALVYVFFTKVLSLGLPAGPLERLLN
jgi:putative tricarboxylic transport membrane protein